ncbi:hypothetical protein ACFWJ5_26980 [Streptomyces qaidamensis]|uniref:hypothetical protein n=1 Tax=Streptomyces qaidamensis TaxID=1783515 RepID=UPI00365F5F4D
MISEQSVSEVTAVLGTPRAAGRALDPERKSAGQTPVPACWRRSSPAGRHRESPQSTGTGALRDERVCGLDCLEAGVGDVDVRAGHGVCSTGSRAEDPDQLDAIEAESLAAHGLRLRFEEVVHQDDNDSLRQRLASSA